MNTIANNKPDRKHHECLNYAPVDVVKGICHLDKVIVAGDQPCCDRCERAPRCAACVHFSSSEGQGIGSCKGGPTPAFAYPSLSAVTCEWFAWAKR
jgi:hypothetical protein